MNQAQRQTTVRSLANSLRLFNRDLQLDIAHLLTVFRSNPVDQGASRLTQHVEQFGLWRQSYLHGPAIRRVLVYHTPQRGVGNLTEVSIESGQLLAVDWGERLAGLQATLDGVGFRPGREIASRWMDTWMFYPRLMAAARPIVSVAVSPNNENPRVNHIGYLVLQLDWDYIAERLLPQVMLEYFSGPEREALYEVALSLDGDSFYFFRPSNPDDGQAESNSRAAGRAGFSLLRSAEAIDSAWLDTADASRPLLLAAGPVLAGAARRGASQRVNLGATPATPQVIEVQRPFDGVAADLEATASGTEAVSSANPQFPFVPERARVFVAGEGPYSLVLAARHVDGSLEQVVARQYLRSVSLAFAVLCVLALAMGLAVVSANRAARLADLRMDFVAGVSHELRTPLSVIRMIGENMADGLLGSGSKARQYGGLLRDYGLRLSQMVEHTLQLAAIESGQKGYELETLDVSEVISSVLADAKPLIEQAGFVIERIDAIDLPVVRADEVALRQSLENLVNNAVKYGEAGRWVRLETAVAETPGPREVLIRVHDRGSGIPLKELSNIFAPYYRARTEAKARTPGSGLGLKLAREMIRGMDGDLTVESEVGHGSTFTIHLPV